MNDRIHACPLWLIPLPALIGLWLGTSSVCAHVGTPYVVFDGKAGQIPVQVIVRQPDVVPGLAEISVRVLEEVPAVVQVRPLHWSTGTRSAPRPDIAQPVSGEPHLYNAELWFMTRGAYAVEITLSGDRGGSVMVPVNSIAQARKPMPVLLGIILTALGLALAVGLIAIIAAATRERTLAAAEVVSAKRRKWAWVGGILGFGVVIGALAGGQLWWNVEEKFHQSRVVFRPLEHMLTLSNDLSATQLIVELTDPRMTNRAYRLLPDHGKTMHLFLAGTADPRAFAHLHPVRSTGQIFRSNLPLLPPGTYHAFLDITHESGLTQTLTNLLTVPPHPLRSAPIPASDPDDSWLLSGPADSLRMPLENGLHMDLQLQHGLSPGKPTQLRATVRDSEDRPVVLEPYLRMLGHAVVLKEDGKVFAHLHPAGTLSMAAARSFARRTGGDDAARSADIVCGDLESLPAEVASQVLSQGTVQFPFVFPTSGHYQLWVQTKVKGQIHTGTFRIHVGEDTHAQN